MSLVNSDTCIKSSLSFLTNSKPNLTTPSLLLSSSPCSFLYLHQYISSTRNPANLVQIHIDVPNHDFLGEMKLDILQGHHLTATSSL
ncbi:hypothetical protein POPTR_014G151351v4 [Populus trichocarpa]|uniref:Uncharacterized protein n=1 Tax=Populus trichocarpa TaxID=3694 RepID=A0ACC0RZA3_POPTR|nr:hypothetical protein POPTR_014G151351v4 [Populus trichocarpa]